MNFRFGKNIEFAISKDLDHRRIETRTCVSINNFQFIKPDSKWGKLKTIIKIESIREFKNSDKPKQTAVRYYISSLEVKPEYFQKAIRSHWAIENKLYRSLDVAFSEDASRKRIGSSAQKLSLTNKILLNLLKNEKTAKQGVKGKKIKVALDNKYLMNVLRL